MYYVNLTILISVSCGSCYAFGSLAMNEARIRVMTNGTQTPVFSTQDIVECSEYSQGLYLYRSFQKPISGSLSLDRDFVRVVSL